MSASQGRVAAVAGAVALAGGVVIGAATPAAAADPVASLVPTRTLASGWLSWVVRSTDQPLATGLSRSGAVDGVPSYSVRTSLTAPPGWPSVVQVVGVAAETDASIALGSDGTVYSIGAVGGQA